jgi:competence ComEA-like helix-hairpin-helix protein
MELAELPNEVRHSQHPLIRGASGYKIEQHQIILSVEEIANPRPLGDISGTLSLELWALDEPYNGGAFAGFAMGGTQVGQLSGQHFWGDSQYQAACQEPPAGKWFLTLMLREWTDVGSVTRDYVNFHLPYIVRPAADVVHTEIAPAAPSNDKVTVEKPARPAEQKPVARKEAEKQPAAAAPKSNHVSVNKATLSELAAVKGMTKKLAESIIAARPFVSLDQVVKVKGMGPKLFDKLQSSLSL